MLHSSPVAIPPVPRPLKRSASVASLPTPPRTHHKRKRGRSKHSSDEDCTASEDEDDAKLIKEAEDEESFWRAANPASKAASPPLLYRRLQAQASQSQVHGVPPVSPPPSHRKPPVKASTPVNLVPVPLTPTPKSASNVSPPSTPPKRQNVASSIPRDSPDNPFLASPLGPDEEVVMNPCDVVPSTQEEKPTMAFVFRGTRRSFPNPYYNSSSSGPNPKSQLPPEHPDFEPEERGVRKLLFGVPGRKKAGPRKGGSKNRAAAEAANRGRGRQGRRPATSANRVPGQSDEEPEEDMKPMKLNFAA
ncbi:hypothetical protein B0H10DRAFT_2213081 [Mycena sp. CBHHK59/15]|nr:hypothetical protein B0H10DRAFT_2213081 [Mycena sp. CBHHK59/15]